MRQVQLVCKYIFDLLAGVLGLIVLSPVLLVVSCAIIINDPGPVFFKQKRIGKDGKTFEILKFRTMVQNAEKIGDGLVVQTEDDPRITKVGRLLRKTSLDELPQLLNIVKGEKDIIGTTKKNLDFMGFQRLEVSPVMKFYARAPGQDKSQHEDQNEIRWLLDCPILTPIL